MHRGDGLRDPLLVYKLYFMTFLGIGRVGRAYGGRLPEHDSRRGGETEGKSDDYWISLCEQGAIDLAQLMKTCPHLFDPSGVDLANYPNVKVMKTDREFGDR